MVGRLSVVCCAILALVLVAGCAGNEERVWDDNLRGLESVPNDPAKGTAAERTYVNTAYKEREELGVARVGMVKVTPTQEGDAEVDQFVERMTVAAQKGCYEALRDSKRFTKAHRADTQMEADFELQVEILTHIAIVQGSVINDPIFHQPRSMFIAIYTLKDLANGETVVRYTTFDTAHFEHVPSAMGGLEASARDLAMELVYIFEEM